MAGSICELLRARRPLVHEGGTTSAGLSWDALQWPGGAFGGKQSFRYLPLSWRLRAAFRHRVAGTAAGRRAVALRHGLGRERSSVQ
jgi:hypothetical protein